MKKFRFGNSQLSCLRRRKFWNGFVRRMGWIQWMGWSWCLVLGKKTVTWICISRWGKFVFMRLDFWNSKSSSHSQGPIYWYGLVCDLPKKSAFVLLGMLLHSTAYTVPDWRQSSFCLYWCFGMYLITVSPCSKFLCCRILFRGLLESWFLNGYICGHLGSRSCPCHDEILQVV